MTPPKGQIGGYGGRVSLVQRKADLLIGRRFANLPTSIQHGFKSHYG
jgi:hypothetical protein